MRKAIDVLWVYYCKRCDDGETLLDLAIELLECRCEIASFWCQYRESRWNPDGRAKEMLEACLAKLPESERGRVWLWRSVAGLVAI